MNCESNHLCERLDAYLDGELCAGEVSAFVAHLTDCTTCREAVDQQQWIDALLQSDVAAAIEAAPPITIRKRINRRWLVAAAAALAALAAWPLFPLPGRDGSNRARSPAATVRRAVVGAESTPEVVATVANPSPIPSLQGRGTGDPPIATFASNGNAIAISHPGGSAQVTIVKLYPTYSAARRWLGDDARGGAEPNGG